MCISFRSSSSSSAHKFPFFHLKSSWSRALVCVTCVLLVWVETIERARDVWLRLDRKGPPDPCLWLLGNTSQVPNVSKGCFLYDLWSVDKCNAWEGSESLLGLSPHSDFSYTWCLFLFLLFILSSCFWCPVMSTSGPRRDEGYGDAMHHQPFLLVLFLKNWIKI